MDGGRSISIFRRFFLSLLFLIATSPSWAVFALVSNRADQGPLFGDAFTSGSLDTSGANLVVIFTHANNNSITSLTDSKGNTITALTEIHTAGNNYLRLWYITNPIVGSGHTVTISAPASDIYASMYIASFSGSNTSSPFDVQSVADSNNTNVTTQQPGSITPTEDNEVVISGGQSGLGTGHTISSVDSGMTQTNTISGLDFFSAAGSLAYIIQTTAGAINPTWTAGTSNKMGAVIASFKSGGAAAAAVPNPHILQRPVFFR